MQSTVVSRLMCALAFVGSSGIAFAQVPFASVNSCTSTSIPAPQGVMLQSSPAGVQISWQPVVAATRYVVVRAPDERAPVTPVETVPGGTLTLLDRGSNAAAWYQVVAVAADGSCRASAPVAFQAPAAGGRFAARDPRTAATAAGSVQLAGAGLSITAIVNPRLNNPANPLANVGDTLLVQGNGFIGITGVALRRAEPLANGQFPPSSPAMPFSGTSTGFRFVVPPVTTACRQAIRFNVIVSRGTVADTSDRPIEVSAPWPARTITSVEQLVVRSATSTGGGRVKIHGVGFGFKDGECGQNEVKFGYFGAGTQGSATNAPITVGNLRDDYVELWLPPTCDQEGILYLAAPAVGGGTSLIVADTPIRVGCSKDPLKRRILGSDQRANGQVPVKPGSTIRIEGPYLRYVTRVTDQMPAPGQAPGSYPFALTGTAPFEQLIVTMPGPKPGPGYLLGFRLEHSRQLDPELGGDMVSGFASVMAAPSWEDIDPKWAEPGQKVTVRGSDFSYGQPPKVAVGGVAAQAVSVTPDQRRIEFRLSPGTVAGPIAIQNEAGTTQLTGPIGRGVGAPAHPGFFVVAGPSVVHSVTQPRPMLAYGDTLVVRGQNLARLGGICVLSTGFGGQRPGYFELRRPEKGFSQAMGNLTTNSEMKVLVEANPQAITAGIAVQLFAPSMPPGDFPPADFACAPNGAGVIWPAP